MIQFGHVDERAVVDERHENANRHTFIVMSNGGDAIFSFTLPSFTPLGVKDYFIYLNW